MTHPFLEFRGEVEAVCRAALDRLGAQDAPIVLEVPPAGLGDLALPCFQLAKRLRRAPQTIAGEIAEGLAAGGLIQRVEAKGAYVNFFLEPQRLTAGVLQELLRSKERYGHLPPKGVRVLLEHTSANPTGPLHIGRARNPIIGDTMVRILRMAGYDVLSEFYVNDVGKQMVMLAYGARNLTPDGVPEREKDDYRYVLHYQAANRAMEEDPSVEDEINGMLYDLEHGDEATIGLVREVCEKVLAALLQSLEEINIKIDQVAWESRFIQEGQVTRLIDRLKSLPLCRQEEDGALALDLNSYGIHGKETDFVFTRKDGTSLYTVRDIAYHLDKFERCDIAIDVLGEDQKLGQMQLAAVLDMLGERRRPEWVFYSFVSLPEGRMSTRKGRVVYLDDLLEEAVDRALVEVRKRREDLSDEDMMRIARSVGIGSVRFNILRIQAEKQIVFRWEEALNFEGNSAPFVQYAHARACSILRKAAEEEELAWSDYDPGRLTRDQERDLVKAIARLPMVVDECAEGRKVHPMALYAQELATLFNQFYQFVPVLRAQEEERGARLALVEASMWALRNSLQCLGVDAPEEM